LCLVNSTNGTKYCTNYSSKRPKSAKGVGGYINSGKYRQSENNSTSLNKYSIHKQSTSSKYNSSSKKVKAANTSHLRKTQPIKSIATKSKKDYLGSSYRKSNISGTHKKYTKTSRGLKKSNNSSSRMNDNGSMLGSNSSKFSPGGTSFRPGIEGQTMNTKSYNSIMTMLMNKEHDMFRSVSGLQISKQMKSSQNTPNSNSKLSSSSRVKTYEVDKTFKRSVDPKSYKKSEINLYSSKPTDKKLQKELEGYLKNTRCRTSRNYVSHSSNAHTYKTQR
jgi:hypothetical protein